MKTRTIWAAAVLALFSGAANAETDKAEPGTTTTQEAPAQSPKCADDETCSSLARYTLEAMQEWRGKKPQGKATHLEEIATDIAEVVIRESRIWDGSNGSREAILLASLAFWESHYEDYVDEFKCNDREWRVSKEGRETLKAGDCDGGHAWGIWQVHLSMFHVKRSEVNRQLVAKYALQIARNSIRSGVGLAHYVGGTGPERKEMARKRLDWATDYVSKHPYVTCRNCSKGASALAKR